jgi:hypothetical protein
MIDSKSIFTSKTFWGAVISLLAQFVPHLFVMFGATSDAAGQAAVVGWAVTIIGFGWTVYGRFMANKPVTVTGGPMVPPINSFPPVGPSPAAVNPSIARNQGREDLP